MEALASQTGTTVLWVNTHDTAVLRDCGGTLMCAEILYMLFCIYSVHIERTSVLSLTTLIQAVTDCLMRRLKTSVRPIMHIREIGNIEIYLRWKQY
jgi:hypothetical protein